MDYPPPTTALKNSRNLLGDLVPGVDGGNAQQYSAGLAEAVKRFQSRHGLVEDGELGPATMQALAVPLAPRVRQLGLTLERLRWLPALRPGRLVVVNLPAFRLWAFDIAAQAISPALEMRVIVGKAAGTPTPVFVTQMRYLDFQPYWNVPSSIERNEIIPQLARDPAYLKKNDMEIVGRDGKLLPAGRPDALAALRAGRARIRHAAPNQIQIKQKCIFSAGRVRQAMDKSEPVADGNLLGRAFVVLVVPASIDLAGTDAGRRAGVGGAPPCGRNRQAKSGVAGWVAHVADGNGLGMATVGRVVDTFGN
ncbi:peptidoglycan hydrolase-like protein with peptidoglycan-binding domain [Duganella sp. 1411]|nr:peptidoglycan hydrolase-like protein with peptidoglycan-binding domain [Duganella sp. 1411]